MKRTLLTRTACLLLTAGLLASCDDSDKPAPAPELTPAQKLSGIYSNKSFTYPEKSLQLDYHSWSLTGCEAELRTEDLKTGTLVLKKVFPGEDEVTISDLALTYNKNQGRYDIERRRNVTTPGGTKFSMGYTNYVQEGTLSVSLGSVVFPDNIFNKNAEGTDWWDMKPLQPDFTGCLHMRWKVTPGTYRVPNPETGEMEDFVVTEEEAENPGDIMNLVPMLANQLLPMFLQKVRFRNAGILQAHYSSDALTSETGPTYQTSPSANLCHFYVRDGKLYVVPRLDMIFQQIKADQTKATSVNLEDILAAINLADRWLSKDGIPFTIRENNDADHSVTIYLGTDQMLPLLKLLPLLKDAITDPTLGVLLGGMIEKLARYVPITEEFEIGLNLVPGTAPAN